MGLKKSRLSKRIRKALQKLRDLSRELGGKNYFLLVGGYSLAQLGLALGEISCAGYVLRTVGEPASLYGVYRAAFGYASAAFSPIGGRIGDKFKEGRLGRRGAIVLGLTLTGASLALIPSLYGALGPSGLIVSSILQSIGASLYWPAYLSRLTELVPEDRRSTAVGTAHTPQALAYSSGTLLGGSLYDLYGPVIFASSLLSVLAGVGVISQIAKKERLKEK
jgi:MFS family permease